MALKIITKMKEKINLHTKGTLKGMSKRFLYFYQTFPTYLAYINSI